MADYIAQEQKALRVESKLALARLNGAHAIRQEIAGRYEWESRHSPLHRSEAYLEDLRKVAENLRLLALCKPALRVIGFTSALPKEGVSTTLSHLALAMARKAETFNQVESQPNLEEAVIVRINSYGKPQGILLVDTQFKNPALHKRFEVERQNGLAEMSNGEFDANTLIKKTAVADLKIITTGMASQVPAGPLDQERLRLLFDAIKSRSEFEFVFVDIPSVLHSAEGVAISRLCEGVVLIVRAHQTRWEIVREAKRQLQTAEVNVLGCVLNRRKFFTPEWLYRKL